MSRMYVCAESWETRENAGSAKLENESKMMRLLKLHSLSNLPTSRPPRNDDGEGKRNIASLRVRDHQRNSRAVRAVLLRLYAKERRGHDARNRGFGLASCSRGLVFLKGTLHRPKAPRTGVPRGGHCRPKNVQRDYRRVGAPSVLDSFSGAARAASYDTH